jgi:hypothetical protein
MKTFLDKAEIDANNWFYLEGMGMGGPPLWARGGGG